MFQSFFFREQTRHLTFQTVTEATCCFWLCPVQKAQLRLLRPPAQLQRSPATGQQRLIGPSMRRLGRPVQPLGLAQLDRLRNFFAVSHVCDDDLRVVRQIAIVSEQWVVQSVLLSSQACGNIALLLHFVCIRIFSLLELCLVGDELK